MMTNNERRAGAAMILCLGMLTAALTSAAAEHITGIDAGVFIILVCQSVAGLIAGMMIRR